MLKSGQPRTKRRNVDKRREKSRYAARNRREKEAGIFTDLYVTVPIVSESTITHVDRIAVLRLAATLCRIQRVVERVFPLDVKDSLSSHLLKDIFCEASINECLDGFLIMVDSSGLIVYISPNCSRNLGLTQTDLIGQNLHEYLHCDDSTTLLSMLDNAAEEKAHAMLRMKSVLSPRGRNLTLKSAVFKAVSFAVSKKVVEFPALQLPPPAPAGAGGGPSPLSAEIGVVTTSSGDISDLDLDDDPDCGGNRGGGSPDTFGTTELDTTYYLMHGVPMIHCGAGAMGDYHGPGTFTTRHGMDMKFSFCHERLSDYLGYDSKALMASSFYSLVHPEDLPVVVEAFKELYRKGQTITGYYRLFVKSGGYVWVTTTANTVTHSSRGHGGQYVICVHHVIRDLENSDLLADIQQMSPSLLCKMESDRKVQKHSKILAGPSIEQLLQRTSTINDYVALPNPSLVMNNNGGGGNGMPAQRVVAFGGGGGGAISVASNSTATTTCRASQADATRKYNPEWLFRAVGGTESRTTTTNKNTGHQQQSASATRRCADECTDSTGLGGFGGPVRRDQQQQQHFDAVETNFHNTIVHNSPERRTKSHHQRASYSTARDSMLVPTDRTYYGAISQADVEHVLFSDVPTPGVQFTNCSIAVAGTGNHHETGGAGTRPAGRPPLPGPGPGPAAQGAPPIMIGGPMTKEDLSMLAPFVHKNDEILSLDFGGGDGVECDDEGTGFSPNLVNELETLFSNTSSSGDNDLNDLRMYIPDAPTATEEGKIESIYRYLRGGDQGSSTTEQSASTATLITKTAAFCGGPRSDGYEPPPRLLTDPNLNQDYQHNLQLPSQSSHHDEEMNFSIF